MDTILFRRRAGAAALIAGPALLLGGSIALPWIGDKSAEETLATAHAHRIATSVGDLLTFLGILVTIPALVALAGRLAGRAPLLALLGPPLWVAGLVGTMLMVVMDQVEVAVGGDELIRSRAATASDDSSAWVLAVVLVVLLVGSALGGILTGLAVLRSRVAPAWAGWALILAVVAGFTAHVVDAKGLDIASAALALAGLAAGAPAVLAGEPAERRAAGATRQEAAATA